MKKSQQPLRYTQAGFGIVEILIALGLGVVIILGVTTLFSDTSRTLRDIDRSGKQLENSLFVFDVIATELSLVGYWGEANYPVNAATDVFRTGEDIETPPAVTWTDPPGACLGTGEVLDLTGLDDSKVELAYAMEYPVFSATGVDLVAEWSDCNSTGSTPKGASEYFVVRRASTCATGASPIPATNRCRVLGNDYHLQTNGCYDETAGLVGGEVKLYKVTDATVATNLNYTSYDCTSTAPIYRYIARIYYVDANDTLVRLYLEQGTTGMEFKPESLVEGVELLRFEWFIDTSGDGEYDVVTRGPTAAQWDDVVGIKVWTVTRSLVEEAGYTDGATYTIAGESWSVPSGNESYRRTVQSRVVELVNVAGRRR